MNCDNDRWRCSVTTGSCCVCLRAIISPVYQRAITWNKSWGLQTQYCYYYLICSDWTLSHRFKLKFSHSTTSILFFSSIMFNVFFFFIPPALRRRSHHSCCAHVFDSVISIPLYHHSVYHLTYSGAPPCTETQCLLSDLFKDKTRHRDTTHTHTLMHML